MGAHHHIHLTGGEPPQHLPNLGRGQEAAQRLHSHTERRAAVPECLGVLLGQQRGGHQYRDLAGVLHRLERSPHRDLGLAEAHVPHDQAVHGHGPLHVALDIGDGLQLVARLLVFEGVLQLSLPRGVGTEGAAGGGHPPLVEHHQLLGHHGHSPAHPALGRRPVGAAHARQRRCLPAGVVADRVDLVGGHIEPVTAPVREQQVLALMAADGPAHHPLESGDPVMLVNHERARREVGEEAALVPRSGPGGSVGAPPAGDVGLGQHRQLDVTQHRAPVEIGVQRLDAGTMIGQQCAQPIRGRARRAQHDAVSVGRQIAQARRQRFDASMGAVPTGCGESLSATGVGRGGHHPDGRGDAVEQVLEAAVQPRHPGRIGAPSLGQPSRQVLFLGQDLAGPVSQPAGLDQDDRPVVRHQIGYHREPLDQPGPPRLHALEELAVGQSVPLFAAPGLARHQ